MKLDRNVLNQEYASPSNYENRISILNHATPPFDLWKWTASHYDLASASTILEVGCGNGAFWQHAAQTLKANQKVILTDFAEGMLDATRNNLDQVNFPCPVEFKLADVEKLPFENESFDAVLAHLMLYHANSQQQAIEEISRVLKPNGWLGASTIPVKSTAEFHILANQIDSKVPCHPVISATFSEEIADALLPKFFSRIKKYFHQSKISVTQPEIVVQFMRNSCTARKFQLSEEFFQQYTLLVNAEIAKKGAIHTTFEFLLYICGKRIDI